MLSESYQSTTHTVNHSFIPQPVSISVDWRTLALWMHCSPISKPNHPAFPLGSKHLAPKSQKALKALKKVIIDNLPPTPLTEQERDIISLYRCMTSWAKNLSSDDRLAVKAILDNPVLYNRVLLNLVNCIEAGAIPANPIDFLGERIIPDALRCLETGKPVTPMALLGA